MSVEVLQSWMFQTGLMVSLLILIILLIRRPFARAFGANAAYALWCLPLIRFCFPMISIPERWMPQALRPESAPPPVADFEAIAPNFESHANVPSGFNEPLQTASSTPSLMAICLIVWVGVASIWLFLQLIQQRQFKARQIEQSEAVSNTLTVEILSVAERMELPNTPNVRVSNEAIGPLVTGVFNPVVILPDNFETNFDEEQRRFALTHEFAHIKRKDLWVALTALIFRAVNWPNPLVHFAAHRLRADQEAACDAFVVRLTGGEAVHSYAETLVKAAKHSVGDKSKMGHLALSLTDAENEISKGD